MKAFLILVTSLASSLLGWAAEPASIDPDTVTHGHANHNGVKIHYVVAGQGEPIIMIHGFPDFWYSWRYQLAALSTHYQVIAMDQRGYNQSDKPEGQEAYAMDLLVGDVAAVMQALGHERATICGHDWGGAVAWHFAMTRPEQTKRLIVLNLPHPHGFAHQLATDPQQQVNSAYARRFQEPGAHESLTAEGLSFFLQDAPAKVKKRYLQAFRRSDFEAMLHYYKQNYPRPPYQTPQGPATKVACPVLLIHGLEDKALLPGALNDTWNWLEKDLTLVTVPGADHWVHHDAPDLVSRAMLSWLQR